MRPIRRGFRTIENLLRIILVGACRIILSIPAAVLKADEEVLSKKLSVSEIRRSRVNRAFNDRLLTRQITLGLCPAFDRVVEERQINSRRQRTRRNFRNFNRRFKEGIFTWEPHRLTAERRIGIADIGRALRLAGNLIVVAQIVVVGIITFVFFEAPGDIQSVPPVNLAWRDGKLVAIIGLFPVKTREIIEIISVRGYGICKVAGAAVNYKLCSFRRNIVTICKRPAITEICHPKRRWIGMEPCRLALHIRHDRLCLVAQVIAISVSSRKTIKPRVRLEVIIVCRRLASRKPMMWFRLAHPIVPCGRRLLIFRFSARYTIVRNKDNVERGLISVVNLPCGAEQGIHTMIKFIVVVHGIIIRVLLCRIAANVLCRINDVIRELTKVINLASVPNAHIYQGISRRIVIIFKNHRFKEGPPREAVTLHDLI